MRRRARECALQILYQMDQNRQLGSGHPDAVDAAIARYWASFESDVPVDRELTERLVRGVCSDVAAVDDAIAAVSHHWKVGRMDMVDRNLIRLAAYEILRCPDIPRAASINEALEMAKRFSNADSVGFINGILDHIRRELGAEVADESR